MTTATAEQTTVLVKYDVTDAEITKLRVGYKDLQCDGPAGYELVRQAIAHMRKLRGQIEKRRVTLKADALAYGRRVDSEAKRITTHLRDIEEPLKARKQLVDAEKERIKQEALEAQRRELETRLRHEREVEEIRLRREREAEELRLWVARQEEDARLAKERATLAAERVVLEEERQKTTAERVAQEAKLRSEQRVIEAERQVVAEVKAQAERAEFERQAVIRAEQEAKDKAERERREEIEQKARLEAIKIDLEALKIEREARLEAIKPDRQRIASFVASIRALQAPVVDDEALAAILVRARQRLADIAADIEHGMKAQS